MDKNGWDNYREEGLQELLRIKESLTLGNKSAQKNFLEIYYEIYKNKKEHEIKGTAFYSKEIKSCILSESEANAKASDVIQRLKLSIEKFYKSDEGKKSVFEIYFIAEEGDYKLGVRPKRLNEQVLEQNEFVTYDEHQHFITTRKPLLIRGLNLLLPFLSPFLIFSCALIIIFETTTHQSWIILFIGYFGLILGVLLFYIGIVLNRLLTRRLVNVVEKYFLEMTDQEDVALVSYSGKCGVKECPGNIVLSKDFKEGTGYLAKCSEYPDGHRFNIDPITLKGRRIKA
jgi:hypothetical protein